MCTFSFENRGLKMLSVNTIKNNLTEVELFFPSEILGFINTHYKDQYLYVLKYLIKNKIYKYDQFIETVTSDVNNSNFKIFSADAFRYNESDANYKRGSGYRDKKRPDHSKKLAGRANIKNRRENWTDKRKHYATNFNNVEWKRSLLLSKGLFVDCLSDDKIIAAFSEYRSSVVTSDAYKMSKIKKFFTNSLYESLYDRGELHNMLTTDIDECYKMINSIISTYHMLSPRNNMGNPKFLKKTYTPNTLPKCKNNNIFTVRSSYEIDFIENFLSNNINDLDYWIYEPTQLRVGNTLYTPDFEVSIDGVVYLIEIKGYVRDEKNFERIQNIVKNVHKNHNYIFITSPKITIAELKLFNTMEIYQKTHPAEYTKAKKGMCLGLSRDEIIGNLLPGSVFVNNGLFFYTVDGDWSIVKFHVLINGMCISEVIYDINNSTIIEHNTSSDRFGEILLKNLDDHLDQFEIIRVKNLEHHNLQ